MRKVKQQIVNGFILAAVIMTASTVLAQQAQSSDKSAKSDDNYVSERGFKNRMFEIKNREPNSLLEVLRPLGSGFKGAAMSVNQEYRTLTVRDFPENIAVVEEALRRLDVAEAQRPDMEFRIYVLLASNTDGAANDFPPELNDVIGQLRTTFKYKDYSLLITSVHRTKDGPGGINNKGVADAKKLTSTPLPSGNPIFYNYILQPISLDLATTAGNSTAHIGNFSFNMRIPISIGTEVRFEDIGFKTPVNIREGEKVVVGTTTMEEKGLIVVLSARLVK
jgi:hypothetical protein